MPRLIDADKLRKDILDLPNCYNGFSDAYDKALIIDLVDEQPTVDAEPVRHGHWCVTQAYPHTIYCSECFQRFAQAHWAIWEDGSLPRDYCPHCGAKMDEVEDG